MWTGRTLAGLLALTLATAGAAAADEAQAENLWEALTEGKASVNVRARVELASSDAEGAEQSEAYTVRTRLGYETRAFGWFSVFGEFENVSSLDDSAYRDPTEGPGSRTIIADPPISQVNQAFVKLAAPDSSFSIVAGRQRLVLDDARFIGNVGWRQNEQTFDAATLRTSFGTEGVDLVYSFLWDINRIFGDLGDGGTRDFESNSHLVNVSYGNESTRLTGFAYLLDFDNSAGDSTNTFGVRLDGKQPMGEGFSVNYQASYARQTDGGGGAGGNPNDYEANYILADANVGSSIGNLGAGYELLGSDDGNARFVTPLATAHKFNGWADVFLNNGGPNGLRDLYAYYAPKLPSRLNARLIYHHFSSDEGGDALGYELDAVISKAINKNFSLLAKATYFYGDEETGPADITRLWLEATVKF